jgi:hypothetical protein
LRVPFTAKALNLAGKPSRAGGLAVRFLGWTAVVFGLAAALGLGLLFGALFGGTVGLAVGLPITLVSLFFGLALVFGGRKLRRHGDETERAARVQAIRALASHQGGSVMAADVARKLELSETDADALLTELAKEPDENVSLELDDDGGLHYLFGQGAQALRIAPVATRIDAAGPAPAARAAAAEQEQAALEEAAAGGPQPQARRRAR